MLRKSAQIPADANICHSKLHFSSDIFKIANSDISFQSNSAFQQESKADITARFRTHQQLAALRSQRCCQASF